MIVPMKKLYLVVQDRDKNDALCALREVGVVHLEKSAFSAGDKSSALSAAIARKTNLEAAMGTLQDTKTPKKKKQASYTAPTSRSRGGRRGRRSSDLYGTEEDEPYSLDAVRGSSRPHLSDLIVSIAKEKKTLQEQDSQIKREITRIEAWGDFDPALIKELEESGLPVFLYELSIEAFSAVCNDEDIRFIKIYQDKKNVRIAVLDREITGVIPFQLPEKSLNTLINETEEIKLDIEELDAKIRNFADRKPQLLRDLSAVEQEIEYQAALVGMENVEFETESLSYLSGYVPVDGIDNLKTAASSKCWALSFDDPDDADENVPTKLKNNKFVNLLNPITGFLGIVPGYREVDISPWFLLFFCIFFGMIFGDAGYGIILSLTAITGIILTARKGVPVALGMLLLLGIFNAAWGVMTCSWFGMEMEYVPQILKDISLGFFSTAKTDQALVTQNLQIFCFSLGLVHLTIARIGGIIRNIRSPRVLAEIANIAMLWGMYNVVLFLVVSIDIRPIPLFPVSIYLLAGGFVISYIFGYYEASIKQSVLDSSKNFISVVLGVTNVFSDIMSYIRLWAVGLAGASIASTVNTMAGPMLGGFIIFAGIILLVFGHGLNLVLNVLSVLVHGVRLNTLEFSSHIGLTWSGTEYRPFKVRN